MIMYKILVGQSVPVLGKEGFMQVTRFGQAFMERVELKTDLKG